MRLTALLLPWALLPIVQVTAIWPYNNKPPATEGFVNAGHLGLEDFDGRVVALGDWNGDQFLDLVTLTSDSRTIQIWLWNRSKYKYVATHLLNMPSVVHNVIASDFNYDGHLDLLVMSEAHETEGGWWGGSSKDELHMTVHLGGGELGSFQGSLYDGTSATTQPIVIDADGSLKPSMLGFDPNSTMRLWKNNGSTFDLIQSPLIGSRVCTLAQPHSSAFVDLDGDCRADIVLHCEVPSNGRKSLQVWRSQHDDGYSLAKQIDLPEGAGPVTFADMDRDGATDLVFPVCESYSMTDGIGYECTINIAYSKQVPMCPGSTSQYDGNRLRCRGWTDLCVPDHDFTFDFDSDGDSFTSFKLSSLNIGSEENNLQLYVPSTGLEPMVPLPLRAGDFNHDGYPDLLFLTHNATAAPSSGGLFGGSHRRPGIQPKLLESVPCQKSRRECWAKVETGRRAFSDITGRHPALLNIWDAERVAWLDVDDNGSLDILVQRSGAQDGQHVTFVINNVFNDAFFIKTLVLNGACDGDCQARQGGPEYKGLGASVAGASLKFTVLDTAGQRVVAQVSQTPQFGYHAMGTPYSFVGLGRTNNYVENVFIGTTLRGEMSQSHLESLVPNSQVIINPPSVLRNLEDPGYGTRQPSTQWRNELFLQPGDWIPWVAATVVTTVLLLGGVVLILGEKEKREDERERRRALHSINFQAL